MKIEIRIPGVLYDRARADLMRAHPFAAERIGFFSASLGSVGPGRLLVLVTRYATIPDEDYIDDPMAGARIGAQAIRSSLQRILDEECGQFHVHTHDHRGAPGPSPMDLRETPRLVESMAATNPEYAHGAMILSQDGAWARVWPPVGQSPVAASRITVVGFPLRFLT